MVKSSEETDYFRGDLWKLIKYSPKMISVLRHFDRDEDPRKSLEKIIDTAKNNPGLDNFLKISKTYDMISRAEKRAEKENWASACQEALKETGVNYEIRGEENIPKEGKVLYISNHPYGLLDSMILIGGLSPLINEKGGELKVIGMNQLRAIKGIEKIVYFVHSTTTKINSDSLKECLRYFNNGGNLALYPSGKTSKAGLEEYPWKEGLGAFASRSSYVVPMWFSGPDHTEIYNFLARFKITEQLRRVFSFSETWDKEGETVVLNIGKPIISEELINPKKLEKKRDNVEIVQDLRQAAEELKVAA